VGHSTETLWVKRLDVRPSQKRTSRHVSGGARNGLMHRRKRHFYSIISAAPLQRAKAAPSLTQEKAPAITPAPSRITDAYIQYQVIPSPLSGHQYSYPSSSL
jgi:hypothetical protein